MKRLSVGGAQENLNLDKLENVYFHIPTLPEQNDITNLLTKIDELIETQIKIIDDYMTYRNAIVDYFFESLSSDWNRIKLSNILKEYSELHVKDNSIVHATLSKEGIFPKTDRYDRDFLVKDEDKKYKVTHLNDICYNPANLKFGVITRNTIGDCIISPIYVMDFFLNLLSSLLQENDSFQEQESMNKEQYMKEWQLIHLIYYLCMFQFHH